MSIEQTIIAFKRAKRARHPERHETKVRKPHPPGLITFEQNGEVKSVERQVEHDARVHTDLTQGVSTTALAHYQGRHRCSRCKRWRPVQEFSVQKRKNGNVFLQSWCKECTADWVREQRQGDVRRLHP